MGYFCMDMGKTVESALQSAEENLKMFKAVNANAECSYLLDFIKGNLEDIADRLSEANKGQQPNTEESPMTEINFPATQTVHTPSGPTNACDDHATQIKGLIGGILGGHVVSTALESPAECDNCVNSANNRHVQKGDKP